METLKQFFKQLKKGMDRAIDEGDVFKANEIAANMLLGTIILFMEIMSLICLLLNEIGIFNADIAIMRKTILMVVFVESPLLYLNYKHHGDASYLKGALCWGILAVCGMLNIALGHNVSFVLVIPSILSLRYCDAKFTRKIVAATILMFFLVALGNAYFGIVNLNVYQFSSETTITVIGKLKEALDLDNIDKWQYFKNSLSNDVLPKLFVFSLVGFACIRISDKGKDLTDMQDRITKKSQRLETELNLATEIQASMLPCIFPAFPEHNELDLFAINYPAKEVGGDFYDYFIIDNDHIAVVMADVSGKGVGAALFMTISKIVLKNQLMSSLDPALALSNTNKQLCENNEAELFVTCWAGIYEISSQTMVFANAGHNPPIILRKNESPHFLVTKKGFVLAGFESSKYVNCQISLKEGDELFLYTDGVTEANDIDHNLYGEERLLKIVEEQRNNSSLDQVNNVMVDLQNYAGQAEQFDDITIMAIKVKEKQIA